MSIFIENMFKIILIFFIIIMLNFVVITPVNAKSTYSCCTDGCIESTILLDKYPAAKEISIAIQACKSGCGIISFQGSFGKDGMVLRDRTKKTLSERCPANFPYKPAYFGYCRDSIQYWVKNCDKNKIEEDKSNNSYKYKKKTTYSNQNPEKYQKSNNNEEVTNCNRDYDSFMQDLTTALQSGNSKALIKPTQQVISCLKASRDSKDDPMIAQFEMMLKMMQR